MQAYSKFLKGYKEDKYSKNDESLSYKANSSLPDNVYNADSIVSVKIRFRAFLISSVELSFESQSTILSLI